MDVEVEVERWGDGNDGEVGRVDRLEVIAFDKRSERLVGWLV